MTKQELMEALLAESVLKLNAKISGVGEFSRRGCRFLRLETGGSVGAESQIWFAQTPAGERPHSGCREGADGVAGVRVHQVDNFPGPLDGETMPVGRQKGAGRANDRKRDRRVLFPCEHTGTMRIAWVGKRSSGRLRIYISWA